jgi:response regulator of citrate/malate metabolism
MLSGSKKSFEIVGYNVDADKAINEISLLKPDLVITELYTKKMSGNALMQKVKKAGIKCEFIMFTDTYSHDELRKFFINGGFDYWLKSFNDLEMEASLKRLVDKLNNFEKTNNIPNLSYTQD